MASMEELKDRIEDETQDSPERFFAVRTIQERGFTRAQCSNCGTYFWSTTERDVCGEPVCSGGYSFINDPPTEKTFDFGQAWTEFADFMEERGYEPINRYPVAARWRDDTEFVRASIYDFQPYVVSGEVEPPANPLVVPQFCLRFNDIENVGVTGRHYTGFIMTGQHAFTEPDSYDQDKYFADMLDWLLEGMEIPIDEVILHEDSWGGGGNLGACMEFFVDGLELFNQVYMFYEVDPAAEKGYSELDTKVLDMGMGHERIVWITHGSETSYEANMEQVVEQLYEATGVDPDAEMWRAFLPHAGLLNVDEVDDMDAAWDEVADAVGVPTKALRKEIEPAAALYSVADHARSLLIALADGILPSNSGERHSLRVIARRAFEIIDSHGWDIDMAEVMAWHATEMAAVYPELQEQVPEVQEIIRHERQKYDQTVQDAERIMETLDEDELTTAKLIELYDSEGLSPDMLERAGFDVDVPDDFYAQVTARHEQDAQEHQTGNDEGLDLTGIPGTEYLFREDERMTRFDAEVVAVIKDGGGRSHVVLDRTCFYPTSGGQMHDEGTLGGQQVVDVTKQDGVVLHRLADGTEPPEEGQTVHGEIDAARRDQLMQHHTATHLINGAAKAVLGDHIWQDGAKKTTQKARLDVTHYRNITDDELADIQAQAREWIEQDLPVDKRTMSKGAAEQQYGFRLYQGGVPPGNQLRVVSVGDVDTEACGGTHVDHTSAVEDLVVTGSSRVQDGLIRIEFRAGPAAREYERFREELQQDIETWLDLDAYTLDTVADIFDVDVADLPGVVERFVDEWEDQRDEIWALEDRVEEGIDHSYDERPHDPQELFQQWKRQKKQIEQLEDMIEDALKQELLEDDDRRITRTIDIDDVGTLISIAQHVTRDDPETAVVLQGTNAVIAARGEDSDADIESLVEERAAVIQPAGDLVKGFKLKR